MSSVSRSFSVKYGSITVGGSATIQVHGTLAFAENHERYRIEFSAIVSEASTASFNSTCASIEAEFHQPRYDLEVKTRNTTRTFKTSDGTGFNHRAEARRVPGSEFDSELSREYRCFVEVDLPADAADNDESVGTQGNRGYNVQVSELGTGQRVVVIGGEYTALPGATAEAQFLAMSDALRDDILDSTDPSLDPDDDWDEQPIERDRDRFNTIVRFSRSWVERIDPDPVATRSGNPEIKNEKVKLELLTGEVSGAAGFAVSRPIEIGMSFTAEIDSTITTDLDTVWRTVVRPRMREIAAAAAALENAGDVRFGRAVVVLLRSINVIQVTATLSAFGGSNVIALQIQTTLVEKPPVVDIPAFDRNPHAVVQLPAPGFLARIRVLTLLIIGEEIGALAFADVLVDPARVFEPAESGPGTPVIPDDAYPNDQSPPFGAHGGGFAPRERVVQWSATDTIGDTAAGDIPLTVTAVSVQYTDRYVAPPNERISFPLSPGA